MIPPALRQSGSIAPTLTMQKASKTRFDLFSADILAKLTRGLR